jgi:xanthine/uracil/vitamin C permease (AzgA family)
MTALEAVFLAGAVVTLVSVVILLALIHAAVPADVDNSRDGA